MEAVNEEAPPCGTMRAVSRHKRRKESLDALCAAENTRYQREYRERQKEEGRPSRTITSRETMVIREKAKRILAERHREELVQIMKDLRAAAKGQSSEDTDGQG